MKKKDISKIKKSLSNKSKKELKEIIIESILKQENYLSKEDILKRDNYECSLCGDKEDLQVHHFKPKFLRSSKRDGVRITLCKYCHWYLHSNPKFKINHSMLVKECVRKDNGITKSYKGNKWGRKPISELKKTEIIKILKVNPEKTIREIAKETGISKSVVHKYINS